MRFFREKDALESPPDYPTDKDAVEYDDDLPVECPAHTTERKLVARIDCE